MAARRYEISLRVACVAAVLCGCASYAGYSSSVENISQVSAANERNIFSTREEKFGISKRPCNVLFII